MKKKTTRRRVFFVFVFVFVFLTTRRRVVRRLCSSLCAKKTKAPNCKGESESKISHAEDDDGNILIPSDHLIDRLQSWE
jgi:hypothetical protein